MFLLATCLVSSSLEEADASFVCLRREVVVLVFKGVVGISSTELDSEALDSEALDLEALDLEALDSAALDSATLDSAALDSAALDWTSSSETTVFWR